MIDTPHRGHVPASLGRQASATALTNVCHTSTIFKDGDPFQGEMNVPDERGLKLRHSSLDARLDRGEMNVPDERGLKR